MLDFQESEYALCCYLFLLQKWTKHGRKMYKCFIRIFLLTYSPIFQNQREPFVELFSDYFRRKSIKILVNFHYKMLEWLFNFKNRNILVLVPTNAVTKNGAFQPIRQRVVWSSSDASQSFAKMPNKTYDTRDQDSVPES